AQWALSLALLQEMQGAKFVEAPDISSFGAALSACEAGRRWQQVLQLLGAMRTSGVPPDIVACNTAISSCFRAERWELALSVFRDLQREKMLAPNVVSFSAAISACERGRLWQQVLELLDEMRFHQVTPNVVTVNATISVLEKTRHWQLALAFFTLARQNKVIPNVITFSSIISACEKGEQWQRSLAIFRDEAMKLPGNVNVVTFGAAMAACERGSKWEEALALSSEMRSRALRPNVITYSALASACEKGQQWDKVLALLADMRRDALRPNAVTYSASLGSWHWSRALGLFQELLLQSLPPDAVAFGNMVASCARGHAWHQALALMQHIRRCGQQPSVVIYNSSMSACEKASQWSLVLDLMEQLRRRASRRRLRGLAAKESFKTPGAAKDVRLGRAAAEAPMLPVASSRNRKAKAAAGTAKYAAAVRTAASETARLADLDAAAVRRLAEFDAAAVRTAASEIARLAEKDASAVRKAALETARLADESAAAVKTAASESARLAEENAPAVMEAAETTAMPSSVIELSIDGKGRCLCATAPAHCCELALAIRFNAWDAVDGLGLLVYRTTSKCSHSCGPSCIAQIGRDGIMELRANSDLQTNAEAQNMGLSDQWRKAYEDRLKKNSEEVRKKPASAWLKGTESLLFLDDMRPWVPPVSDPADGTTGPPPFDADDEKSTPRPHKVLIFCQFHASMDLLQAYCAFRNWRALRLDGGTSRVLRELDMRDFNSHDEDYFVYIIGTRAGGLGINLATANHVVLFEQDWNPHVDSQAIDRAHRIGQYRKVFIYRLIQEWGVEERLHHRQQTKLRMEQCVINKKTEADDGAGADGEAAMDASEKLSAEEVMLLLQHGEGVLKNFSGENLAPLTLQDLLERPHRPFPALAKEEAPSSPPSLQGIKEEFIEDTGEGREAPRNANGAEEEPPLPPPPPANRRREVPDLEFAAPVKRTSSGRIIKVPTQFVVEEIEKKVSVKKDLVKHFKHCFCCGDGPAKKVKRGRKKAQDSESEEDPLELDLFCNTCPNGYHKSCVPPHAREVTKNGFAGKRWACPWHACGMCSRTANACGGMLIHCSECPSALCYDCFPPNFRRVYPPEKFWTELNGRGWNVSPQKMVFFKCNSCRTLDDQNKRQQMRAEDLEAQQDEKKRAALEEKRSLAATKKRLEEEEARRRLKMHLLEHERSALSTEIQRMRDRVVRAAEQLWPPTFRSKWIDRCRSTKGQQELSKLAMAHLKSAAAPSVERLSQALAICSNCNFPGHKVKQCPLPPEKESISTKSETGGSGTKGYYKRGCSLCQSASHGRMQCSKLNPEQRSEYEGRRDQLKQLAEALEKATTLTEPKLDEAATAPKALVEVWKETEDRVWCQVDAVLRESGDLSRLHGADAFCCCW
ncbi:unnamed protein product, partial [Polarella glacialis]